MIPPPTRKARKLTQAYTNLLALNVQPTVVVPLPGLSFFDAEYKLVNSQFCPLL